MDNHWRQPWNSNGQAAQSVCVCIPDCGGHFYRWPVVVSHGQLSGEDNADRLRVAPIVN
jgi:hypothetical protein